MAGIEDKAPRIHLFLMKIFAVTDNIRLLSTNPPYSRAKLMNMTSKACFVAMSIGVLSATFARPAMAQHNALTIEAPNDDFVDSVDKVIGWEFDVYLPIDVHELGVFDFGLDGLATNHEVAIWKADKTLLVSAAVPAGTSARVGDNFRFVTVPLTRLEPGVGYVIAATWPAMGDPSTYMWRPAMPAQPEYYFQNWGFPGELRLASGAAPYSQGSAAIAFPEGSSPVASRAHMGPNFTFVPEPASGAMAATAALLIAGMTRQRYRSAC